LEIKNLTENNKTLRLAKRNEMKFENWEKMAAVLRFAILCLKNVLAIKKYAMSRKALKKTKKQ
jgi:hypothetical protein